MSNPAFSTKARPTFQSFGPGMADDARKAMNGAFDALANWRNELASITDRNSDAVFDKMSAAAKSVGWPSEFVDLTRQQMQQASKMQMQAMDHVMDMWEQQVKNPGAAFNMPAQMMDAMKNMPGFGSTPAQFPGFGSMPNMMNMPGMQSMGGMPMVPLQFWMQAAEMWQKSWQQALSSWMEAQSNMFNQKGPGR